MERHEKHFVIQIGNKADKVTITRLKSAHLLDEEIDVDHDDEPVFRNKRRKNWDVIIPRNGQPATQPEPPKPNNNQRQPTLPKSNIPPPPRFPTKKFNNRDRTTPRWNTPFRNSRSQQQSIPIQEAGTSTQAEETQNRQENQRASGALTNQAGKPRITNQFTGYSYIPPESRAKPQEKRQDQASQQTKDAGGKLPIVHQNEQSNNTAGTSSGRPEQHENPEPRRSGRSTKGLPPKRRGFIPRWK